LKRRRIEAVKLKGGRSTRYYLRSGGHRIGEWSSPFKVRIDKPATSVVVEKGRHAHQSPMHFLLYALVLEFASDRVRPAHWPPEQLAGDWVFNTDKCQKILFERYGEPPWTAQHIILAVCKKRLKCHYCRADILAGFALTGC
jgi:hypothetical protein